jgi:hypothetical protein
MATLARSDRSLAPQARGAKLDDAGTVAAVLEDCVAGTRQTVSDLDW